MEANNEVWLGAHYWVMMTMEANNELEQTLIVYECLWMSWERKTGCRSPAIAVQLRAQSWQVSLVKRLWFHDEVTSDWTNSNDASKLCENLHAKLQISHVFGEILIKFTGKPLLCHAETKHGVPRRTRSCWSRISLFWSCGDLWIEPRRSNWYRSTISNKN